MSPTNEKLFEVGIYLVDRSKFNLFYLNVDKIYIYNILVVLYKLQRVRSLLYM